jgi:hypothetical protein
MRRYDEKSVHEQLQQPTDNEKYVANRRSLIRANRWPSALGGRKWLKFADGCSEHNTSGDLSFDRGAKFVTSNRFEIPPVMGRGLAEHMPRPDRVGWKGRCAP